MRVELIGLLEHHKPNPIQLFTMTEKHETGVNHIVEALQRYITDLSALECLPQTLYIQMDNCTRENMHRFMFAYI